MQSNKLTDCKEVSGNKYKAMEFPLFTLCIKWDVFESCDSVGCRFYEISSYVFCFG